jgi:hypothetical protein
MSFTICLATARTIEYSQGGGREGLVVARYYRFRPSSTSSASS